MKITSEDVKAVQARMDVTYEEAERYLVKANGDIELAIYLIEEKKASNLSKFMTELNRIAKELMTYYVKIDRKKEVLLNLPLIMIVLFLVFLEVETKIWVLVIGIGAILISESQVTIYKRSKDSDGIINQPEVIEKEEAVSSHNNEQRAARRGNTTTPPNNKPLDSVDENKDDDYYEVTIEK
ncbi:hypothetical protein [Petrocella sp. FN5]|uniref:hypothetical protein n=1 Tax=Petrocella sp. FN5 TaxID=3032002 RepID=UPI0023DA7F76|nr:hypothetical protein [Petrocella sp. FN5]MDF1616536.1 hypothetical protein [Petrocella sp. FN5]